MCKGLKKCDLQSEIAGKEAEEMEPLMSSTKLGDGEWDDGDTGADNQDNNFQIIKLLVGEWSLYLDKRWLKWSMSFLNGWNDEIHFSFSRMFEIEYSLIRQLEWNREEIRRMVGGEGCQ